MPQERRSSERRSVSEEGMLSEGMHFRLCRVRDLSLGGAFLEVGWSILSRDHPVDLALTLLSDHQPKPRVYHLSAEVTRIATDGTAIRFKSLDQTTSNALFGHLKRSV